MSIFGACVVRVSDRLLLHQLVVASDVQQPPPVWGEVISKCCAPNFRTSAFVDCSDSPQRIGYHILSDDEVAFALITDEQMTRRGAHLILDEISKLFHKMFVEAPHKLSSKSCDVFQQPLQQLIARQVSSAGVDEKVKQVKRTVEEVKGLALDNVERVLARGQQIDEIISATDDLQSQSQGFQRSSRALRNQMWWNNAKAKAFVVGGVVAFLLIVYFVFCGGLSCSSSS
jgi:hypothetical protein